MYRQALRSWTKDCIQGDNDAVVCRAAHSIRILCQTGCYRKNQDSFHVAKGGNAMLNNQKGKIGWILLWALGVPIPILLVLYFLRGCT
jgi:hypothetical protein